MSDLAHAEWPSDETVLAGGLFISLAIAIDRGRVNEADRLRRRLAELGFSVNVTSAHAGGSSSSKILPLTTGRPAPKGRRFAIIDGDDGHHPDVRTEAGLAEVPILPGPFRKSRVDPGSRSHSTRDLDPTPTSHHDDRAIDGILRND